MRVDFLDNEDDGNYDGIYDTESAQVTEKPNQHFTNLLDHGNTQNPYYEGDIDLLTQENDRSNKNHPIPDFKDTAVITSSQNIYYEL